MKYHGHCAYCGRPLKMKAMTVDHLVPKSKGGGNCTRVDDALEELYNIKVGNKYNLLFISTQFLFSI